jgi:polyhydroxyalkanoate synthesis regulator phasin
MSEVRRAVEKTVQSTVGSAGMTRERAQDLVDDVVRRAEQGATRAGRGVREAGHRQAEAAAGVGDRLREAIPDLWVATREDIRRLGAELDRLAARVDRLDRELGRTGSSRTSARPKTAAKRTAAKRSATKRRTTAKPKRSTR